jgi:predicted transcriptional regulator
MGKARGLGELEFDVLDCIWESNVPLNLRRVYEKIISNPKHRNLNYRTIATVLHRLTNKNMINKKKEQGIYHYTSIVSKEDVLRQRVRLIKDNFFAGNASAFISYLLKDKSNYDPDEIKQLIEDLFK